ncbi:unnamed protein product, partial [Mesorhabditis spiculigera]
MYGIVPLVLLCLIAFGEAGPWSDEFTDDENAMAFEVDNDMDTLEAGYKTIKVVKARDNDDGDYWGGGPKWKPFQPPPADEEGDDEFEFVTSAPRRHHKFHGKASRRLAKKHKPKKHIVEEEEEDDRWNEGETDLQTTSVVPETTETAESREATEAPITTTIAHKRKAKKSHKKSEKPVKKAKKPANIVGDWTDEESGNLHGLTAVDEADGDEKDNKSTPEPIEEGSGQEPDAKREVKI